MTMREREHGRSSISALGSVYYMVKMLLALFVGLFRRRVVPLEDVTEVTPLHVSIVASIASILLLLVVFELIRSPPAARALRAALARDRASCCSCSRPGATG